MNALDDLRALQDQRSTKPPKTAPTIISWRVEHDLATATSVYEYDEALVAQALDAPDDFVIAPVGKIRFINAPERPDPVRSPEPDEMTFGQLLALYG